MITYKDLVKKVHPDLNPNIKDPGEKIAKIMANKNNPSMLMELGIRWGVIDGPKKKTDPFKNFKTQKTSPWITFYHGDYIVKGTKIRFKTKNGFKEAYYVYKAKGEIFLTDLLGYFSIKTSFDKLFGKIEHNPNDFIYKSEIIRWTNFIKNDKKTADNKIKNNPMFGEKISNHDEIFNILNIKQNCNYSRETKFVYYQFGWYKIIKTNKKCVFIDFNGEIRKLQLKVIKSSK